MRRVCFWRENTTNGGFNLAVVGEIEIHGTLRKSKGEEKVYESLNKVIAPGFVPLTEDDEGVESARNGRRSELSKRRMRFAVLCRWKCIENQWSARRELAERSAMSNILNNARKIRERRKLRIRSADCSTRWVAASEHRAEERREYLGEHPSSWGKF